MLKAVLKMLETKDTDEIKVYAAKVNRAKIMLDGITLELEKKFEAEPRSISPSVLTPSIPQVPVEKAKPVNRFQYLPVVKNGRLYELKVQDTINNKVTEASEDFKLKINGKDTTYGKAKGEPFQKIKLI